MNLSDWKITIDGQPIRISREPLQDIRSKNQKRKDRKEWFKHKRKMRGSIDIELPIEKPWHERIIIKEGE